MLITTAIDARHFGLPVGGELRTRGQVCLQTVTPKRDRVAFAAAAVSFPGLPAWRPPS